MINSISAGDIARLRKSVPQTAWQKLLRTIRTNWPPGGAGLWLAQQPPATRAAVDRQLLFRFTAYYVERCEMLARPTQPAPQPVTPRQRLMATRVATFLNFFGSRLSTGENSFQFHRVTRMADAQAVVTAQEGDVLRVQSPRFSRINVRRELYVAADYRRTITPYIGEMPHKLHAQPLWMDEVITVTDGAFTCRVAHCRYIVAGKGFQVRHHDGWLAWLAPGNELIRGEQFDTRAHPQLLVAAKDVRGALARLRRAIQCLQVRLLAEKHTYTTLGRMTGVPELLELELHLRGGSDPDERAVLHKLRDLVNNGSSRLPGYAVFDTIYAARQTGDTTFAKAAPRALLRAWFSEALFRARWKTEEARQWQERAQAPLLKVGLA